MKPFHKTQKDTKKHLYERANEKTHFVVIMTFISMLFIPIIFKLFYNPAHISTSAIILPKELGLSTIAALGSTWLLHYAEMFRKSDNYRKFRFTMAAINLTGWLFLALQYLAWKNIFAQANPTATLIGAIVVLHAFHFVIASAMLLFSFIRVAGINTSADLYIHFLNPERAKFFETGRRFWNYLALLWAGMYAVILLK